MTKFDHVHRSSPVHRHGGGQLRVTRHSIAVETPVAMVYKGMPHVVMMASPADLEDFALGFSLSEAIIRHPDEMLTIRAEPSEKGIVLNMQIDDERFQALFDRHRFLPGRTGCGLCGVESLEQAIPELKPVPDTPGDIEPQAIYRAFKALHDLQPEKQATGAVHGAAWCSSDGDIRLVREDVGRHNALDKLIGVMVRSGMSFDDGFCLITSRCSYEMVQKAIQMGMGLVAAISAPTTLAVELANAHNLTLVAMARAETFTVFTHARRIAGRPAKNSVQVS
jgi:FdhD protein